MDEDQITEELRIEQGERERLEREAAERAHSKDETGQHRARADKAAYLREKLEERERAEAEEED